MSSLILALFMGATHPKFPPKGVVERDQYHVPIVRAGSFGEALRLMGRTVAQDRLWQMETSRRIAQGRMAEVLGKSALAGDLDTLKTGYTDEEYTEMFESLPPRAKEAYVSYAEGVNETIQLRTANGTLPSEYEKNSLKPEEWTVKDSLSIVVMLSRRFGTGGAGELRNFALYLYLKSQPCKDRVLDVLDDLAWQNDPKSIPTVSPSEDPLAKSHPTFPTVDRAKTLRHLDSLPKVGLLELLPAVRAANGEDSRLLAESVQAPFKTGSYCMVVSPRRSSTGNALLLSGPQMGMSIPSIVHEIALDAPGIRVEGIDVPGIPAVVIGNTPFFAWGLTTGVADISDIVFANLKDKDNQLFGDQTRPVKRFKRTVKVKGSADVTTEVVRTVDGPVLLESLSTKTVFSQRSSYWMKEAESWAALYDLYGAKSAQDIDSKASQIAMNMNFFYATKDGDIGWRYIGRFPVRASGFDPRFPTPSGPEADWKGFLSPDKSPHVRNPKSGLIANWNNKPVSWWPNSDTPVWGSVFRNEVLLRHLSTPKLAPWDLEQAAWKIAREDSDTNSCLRGFFQGLTTKPAADRLMMAYDGQTLGAPWTLYRAAFDELRRDLFLPHTGNFTSDSYFRQIIQPSVVAKAIKGQTKYPFLGKKSPEKVASKALIAAWDELCTANGDEPAAWPLTVPFFRAPDGSPVYFSNRGTYIQVTELASRPVGRSLSPPGVTEAGAGSDSQVGLAKQWVLKPMWRLSD